MFPESAYVLDPKEPSSAIFSLSDKTLIVDGKSLNLRMSENKNDFFHGWTKDKTGRLKAVPKAGLHGVFLVAEKSGDKLVPRGHR